MEGRIGFQMGWCRCNARKDYFPDWAYVGSGGFNVGMDRRGTLSSLI